MRLPWAVALLALLAGRYWWWRLTSTLVLDDWLSTSMSVLVLLAETWLLAHSFLQLAFSLAPDPRIAPRAERAAARVQRRLEPAGSVSVPLPWVDVLIPTFGEPLELVERCLRGCLALTYPRAEVWLLDDAARPELQELCRRLGCRYSSRAGREHAKAGNLNHVLPLLQGELIAVFDADVVPLNTFLLRSVGLFDEPRVALVQSPQTYMSADPVIRNLRLERWLMPDEESFYRWIEPVRQGVGAVVCAGTSFLVRRSALLAVGGFDTGTSSEDLATGIRLTAAGGECVYLPEKLSAGLAPFTASALVRQRCRWASGTLQTLRTGASPLRIAGLTPLQRLAFLEGILHWFNALPQLLLALMPLMIGVLGVLPLQITAAGLLRYALPFFGAQLLLARWFSNQARTGLLPELYRWIVLIPLVATICRWALQRPLRFQVTPKALAIAGRQAADPRLWLPLLVLLLLQLLALLNLFGWAQDPTGPALAPVTPASLALGVSWSLINALLLLLALRCCWDRPRRSALPWFAVREPACLDGQPVLLRAISEEGVELALAPAARQAGQVALPLAGPASLLQLTWGQECWPLQLAACRGHRLGALWSGLSPRQQRTLQQRLYRQSGLWPHRRAPFEPLALLAVLGRLLSPIPPDDWFRRSLVPIQLTAPARSQRLVPPRAYPTAELAV
ncbi:glycosyltransferase [Cyanobium sp. LEGE 06113]|uniref:glycosyltransferase family 2 protein n=1 Tax=Cyanobium sp. LEGE 06113 TaxID=1297573 RepID=UPI00187F2E5E|nr:cellulose synthase catalytic subunit [Cyanobium sp. LEGE 06113]MBE9153428.1 glycosyltransferase [Cyanobium sp. LEGE 06113]